MHALLIDNYDSYTYNLFQLIAQVYGKEPTVVLNDDPRWPTLDPATFDCVVLSPGPGRPHRARDLGHCRDVLDRAGSLPVLGVCLGHQAIAHHAGATVVEGTPRHGHLTTVRHAGDDLFSGLPKDFTAVRYHSLRVLEPLPDTLCATAWAEDGTVMALRHRTLPRWGVQFHPESIATEHGARLLRNFAALNGRDFGPGLHAGDSRPPLATATTPWRAAAHTEGRPLRLVVDTIDHAVDTERAFTELYRDRTPAFWLDSSQSEPGRARFSFLGGDTGPLAETLTYRVADRAVTVRRAGRTHREPGTIFDVLDRRLAQRRLPDDDLPFELNGGYVGYFGYELKADCGSPNAHTADTPDAVWLFADRLVVVDHEADRTYALAVSEPGHEPMALARAWVEETLRRVRPLRRAPGGTATDGVDAAPGEPELARARAQYVADIHTCLAELRRGESYEICLTNRVSLPTIGDPLRYYLLLRAVNPAPYAAFLRLGDVSVMSSSPERFLRISRDGAAESKPIKGTVSRHRDPAADEAARRSLTDSAKTRAENLMIVDLMRNDLGRVCEIGSIDVPSYLATESYATVHQLVTTIRGQLRPAIRPVDCVRACFPGGSMTGAPKLRTMEIIDRLETEARGVYSGALGYFGLGGGADLSIVIRTAVASPARTVIGAGGAIVLDSDPEDEFDETLLKARALLRAHRAYLDAAGDA
ncbi:aminodeoxychorismate synthase component I [Solihabitans fulvus]|uniref:aminodeoxychorismate synthase n=1 Tax=Solihabitans fulvus TaxID=1892852 RepID=A0A5B2WKG3_9PSEU|nr:aminodeoxychorismate synthase component I [Solihabitans fulvus]